MALRGGNALNKGSARKSAKFVKAKHTPAQKGAAQDAYRASKKAAVTKGKLGKPAAKRAQTKAKAGTMRMSAKHPRNKR